jgi:predicted nucleic acid-binding protein
MTTAIDTNILVALWDKEEPLSPVVGPALDAALERGSLVVAAPVYGELLAFPSRSESFLDKFFSDTRIFVDWNLNESVWRAAGRAFQAFAVRRRKHRDPGPRRILVDFLIGAHALQNGYSLLTLDERFFHAAFPHLSLMKVQNK